MESPIEQLFDKLGASYAVVLKPYEELSMKELIRKRAVVEDRIAQAGGVAPEWAERNGHPQSSEMVCLWDKPVPYKAGHRKYLMRTILGSGTWEDQVTHVWAYPFALDSPPLRSQIVEYREMTLQALEAADTRYVLMVGSLPMLIWRDVKLRQIQGHSGVLERKWIVGPIENPASVLRDPMLQGQWRLDLYSFMDMVRNREDFNLTTRCMERDCTEGVLMYDPDGLGWCKRHWKKGNRQQETKLAGLRKKSRKLNQKAMELE